MKKFLSPRVFLLFVLVSILFVGDGPNNGVNGQLSDIVKSISEKFGEAIGAVTGVTCIAKHRQEFQDCQSLVEEIIDHDYRQSDMKKFCCSFIPFSACIDQTAKQYCGQDARKAVDAIINALRYNAYQGECQRYDNLVSCMDPTLFWVLAILAIIIVISIVCGLLGFIKRACF